MWLSSMSALNVMFMLVKVGQEMGYAAAAAHAALLPAD